MSPGPLPTTSFASWGLGLERPLLIAGPCSAESADQVLATARGIRKHAPQVKAFRAGVWKPRTRPDSFEGVGAEALSWLRDVKKETGLLTMTEVATTDHVEACLNSGVDMLWIGARTTPNPFSIQEIANALRGVDIPVFVKNPIHPDLELWIGALERLSRAGITKLAAIHRGFSWFEHRDPNKPAATRNSTMWEFPIRLKVAFPELELLCDPSHIAGSLDGLDQISQRALDLNFSGLMIETHYDPMKALSDPQQQLDPSALGDLLASLIFRQASPTAEGQDHLRDLRDLIDQLDEDIAQKLGARMDIVERIGEYKAQHNVAILQPARWEQIMRRQHHLCLELGLDAGFVEAFMNAIHDESIRRQTVDEEDALVGIPGGRSKHHEE